MKKLFLLSIFIILAVFSDNIFALNITTHSSIQTSCNWWTFPPLTIYWTDWYHLRDLLNASWEWIISSDSTVSVFINSNKLTVPNSWVKASNYVPNAGSFYAIWNNWITTLNIPNLVPADRDQPIWQIVYKVKRMYTWPNNTYSFTWNYIYSPFTWIIPVQTALWNLDKKFDLSTLKQDEECISILPRWCWDGILDTADWETCEPGDASHTWWWVGGCSAACLPIGVACIPWPTVWPQPWAITAADVWLCPVWSAVWWFTSTTLWLTTTYTWSCWWSAVWWACSASYTTTWGGWWGSCIPWPTTWAQPSPLTATSVWLCPAWVAISGFNATTVWSTTTYTWSCWWNSWWSCIATYSTWGGWWGWGWWGGWWGWWWSSINSYCWDGIIQKPNPQWQDETCDTPEPWCKNCYVTKTNPWENWPWKITVTNPWQVNSYFSISSYKIIAWNNVPLFTDKDEIRFESSSNLYLWGQPVGIINKANSIISGTGKAYVFPAWTWVGRIDYVDHNVYDGSGKLINIVYRTVNYPANIRLFDGSEIKYFKWDTSKFSNSEIYRDTDMSAFYPSQWKNDFYVNVWYIEEAMPIRVTKNIVSNVSWGNAYIYNPLWFDVNYVVGGFIDKLAQWNFTATSVNVRNRQWQNLSSMTSQIVSDSSFNNKINESNIKEWTQLNSSDFTKNNALSDIIIKNSTDFEKLLTQVWDNPNIRTIKNKNLIIDANTLDINIVWVKTIIVENWDLIINRNISYLWTDSSWAFIVKNGNILISKDVSKISWVYMVMNWALWSSDWATEKQLIVEWSLYGNSENLSLNRTFVRWTEWSSALTTWIIVNYSNRVLKNPPPMLTNFVSEYNEKRIAR